jgi:hypothetical protein
MLAEMTGCRCLAILLALGCAAPAVHAETFKWVDENGRINYSNNPPPSGKAAKAVQTVEDRISTYQADPALKRAASTRRPDAADAEWLQRQRIMAMRAAIPDCQTRGDCGNDGYRRSVYIAYAAYPVFLPAFPRRHAPRSRPARSFR